MKSAAGFGRLLSNRSVGSIAPRSAFGRGGHSLGLSLARAVTPVPYAHGRTSCDIRKFSSLSQHNELVKALSDELASEESDFEVDPDLVEITEQIKKSFTIDDQVGLGVVKLSSNFSGAMGGDEEVSISFDCQDEADMDGMNMESLASLAEGIDDEDDDDDVVLDFGINVKVAISKKDGSKLVVDCIAAKELQIEGVQYVPSSFNKSKAEQEEEVYGGPVFDQLDESVQDAFYEYLADRKIDDDLAFFVLAYSRDKEQKEYINWLSNVMHFAS